MAGRGWVGENENLQDTGFPCPGAQTDAHGLYVCVQALGSGVRGGWGPGSVP